MTHAPGGIADLSPLNRAREQRAWYWYDWANSAYVTTTAAVLFAPYLTSVAERSACGKPTDDDFTCRVDLSILGVHVSAGSLVFYLVTVSTIISALVLPVVGAVADRSARKTTMMAGFAWAGSLLAMSMFLVAGTDWQLGALLLVGATLCLGASLVVYDAILCEIAEPDERDRVSSRGWALGYLGGGLLLAAELRAAHRDERRHRARGADLPAQRRHLVGGVHDHPVPRRAQPAAAQRGAGAGRPACSRASASSGPR